MEANPNPLQKTQRLVWMDLEMTGLNPDQDVIIEIATIITEADLSVVARGPELVIHQEDAILEQMDEWNTNHHGQSGLTDKVRSSEWSCQMAEKATLDFIKEHIPAGQGILSGNSIWQDRRFIIRHMPELDRYLHYRMLDVSSVKILRQCWYNGKDFPKKGSHRALEDIEESIEELKFYRSEIFKGAL